ncbi:MULTISPECIES: alpha-L-fucosidase [unclassified Sphingomonas]|uniref:alpha-L-fucosidase n=1 Tax=unclassified Sphingomonas TaxID=196159 RepID=UPI0007001283|nr:MULTISPECIES: alpha-L-fucosidase [unclassified Sphingomonas]KQS51497.1 alpha-L-fucosidase [Sphingomonas sp. Leaf198]
MTVNRRDALGMVAGGMMAGGGIAGPALAGGSRAASSAAAAPFTADWNSLTQGYRAPDWYRDAKFGIWAHWSAQCVPEEGDWYARNMYLQGSRANKAHVAKYGHPSDVGYLEVVGKWHAEKWQPERLLDLYVAAGAKYFVALAGHHDNVDTFASAHHDWNTLRVGPKRDIIGTWERAARARGLRFGVSNHGAHAWHWLQTAYGYDPEGPRAGQRYDASRLTTADGRGTWWQGLDPQALYTGRTMPLPDGVRTIAEAEAIHARTDELWVEDAPAAQAAFVRNWALRCRDLLDRYRPDLIYFDDYGLPFGETGLEIAAHFYNASRGWSDGRLEAVINAKMMPAERRMGLVEDVERGGKDHIETYPWQTDTCLGNWHYDRALYERDGYKSAATIIHTLCDVVSKNGNLLLSVPMRGDGTIDEKEEAILTEIAGWMRLNGAAIYGTRPWRIHAEGPTKPASGMFAENGPKSPYTARDVRYVRSGDDVHALVMGWPADGIARLTLFAANSIIGRGSVARVTLAGDTTPLAFRRTGQALEVTLPPARRHAIGVALVLSGTGLTEGSLVSQPT